MWVSVGQEAKANTGRRCQPGQTINWSTDAGYIPPQARVFALAAAAVVLAIYEEVREKL